MRPSAYRFPLLAAVVTTVVLALPAVSSATVPSPVSSANWNVRHSWVNYLTNPAWYLGFGQGSVTPTAFGGGTPSTDPSGGQTSWGSGYTEYAYGYVFGVASDSGSPRTVALKGGLDFDMSAHGIDISLSDLKVVVNGSGEQLVADATYVPLGGSTQTLNDTVVADVSSAGAVTLTAAGATVFNGGSNGSYSAGDAFGTVSYS
jgi:hypothetical protein